jgi:hypothetical protein
MALHVGWRYFKPFPLHHPRDYEQTCVVAALQAKGLSDNKAFNFISRVFIRTLREYGYTKTPDGVWVRRELLEAAIRGRDYKNRCGLCDAAGPHLDKRFGRLCHRHYMYAHKRRQRGDVDPYVGIEELDRRRATPASRMIRCDNCGDVKRRWRCKLNQRVRNFCGQDCYNAARGKKMTAAGRAFVTPHAVMRFQERVSTLFYDAALGAIIKGLESPSKTYSSGHGKGLIVEVKEPYEFKAVLMPGEGGKPAVVTILESEKENDAARARRSLRRKAA